MWMVIDRDQWIEVNLAEVAAECVQKGYKLCVSNPAFELWLLLHIKDIDGYSAEEIKELERNDHVTPNRTRLDQELLCLLGSYNKNNLNMEHFFPGISHAVDRARALDANPTDRWPRSLGTRVYLLVEKIC